MVIKGDGSTLWIGTWDKLFRWDNAPQGLPQPVADTGKVNTIIQDGNTLWIGSEKGLFRWYNPHQELPQHIQVNTGPIRKLHKVGPTLLISARDGLFIWKNADVGEPIRVDLDVSYINVFYQDGSVLWIGSEKGLLRWDTTGDKEPAFTQEINNVAVTGIKKDGSTLVVGTSKGLFRWIEPGARLPDQFLDGSEIYSLYQDSSTFLFSVKGKGLYRWGNIHVGEPNFIDREINLVPKYYKIGSIIWLGAGPEGITRTIRLDSQKEDRPLHIASLDTGFVHDFYQSGQTLWIGAQKGLFRIEGLGTDWDARLRISSSLPTIINTDHNLVIKWEVGNFGWRTPRGQTHYRVIVKDAAGNVVNPDSDVYGKQEATLPPLKAGTYSLYIQATDLMGNVSESQPVEFTVYSSLKEFFLYWGRWASLGYLILTIIAFLILFIGARWSKRCFEFLTAPVVRKFGIYFGFALRYITPIRIWIFERYFDELKKDWSDNKLYVPYHLKAQEGRSASPVTLIKSTEIINRLKNESRILIIGEPGTGKSALAKNLMQAYCGEPSLRAAWRKYSFIPIWIRLRELAGSHDAKVTELALSTLAGKEMIFDKVDSFFESLLRNGDFLIILDGLNEVNIDGAVNEFAVTHSSVRLLATSQTDSLSDIFKRYTLPLFEREFAKTLLREFIRDESAEKTISAENAIKEVPELWDEIICGYDVRLAQYLIESSKTGVELTSPPSEKSSPLPKNRLELYRAMVEYSTKIDEPERTEHLIIAISRRAWNMWRDGQYIFKADDSLSEAEIKHLVKTKLAIERPQGYEFRHSLMRDFLSAEFCTRHSGSTDIMLKIRFGGEEAEKIWELPVAEQHSVFSFLTESIDKVEDLLEIFKFASEKWKEREVLLRAVDESAKKRGWKIEVNIKSGL
jgi:hypothetical protein